MHTNVLVCLLLIMNHLDDDDLENQVPHFITRLPKTRSALQFTIHNSQYYISNLLNLNHKLMPRADVINVIPLLLSQEWNITYYMGIILIQSVPALWEYYISFHYSLIISIIIGLVHCYLLFWCNQTPTPESGLDSTALPPMPCSDSSYITIYNQALRMDEAPMSLNRSGILLFHSHSHYHY